MKLLCSVFRFRYYENAIYSLHACFELEFLEESLLEPVSCLGGQAPIDVIIQEDISTVRKHRSFHKAFKVHESLGKRGRVCFLYQTLKIAWLPPTSRLFC